MLRELLIDLVSKDNDELIVNLERVEFLDSTGLGVLVGGLKRVRAHDGSLDLVCTQERMLKIFRITGLTKVFGIQRQWTRPSRPRGAGKEPVTGGEIAESFGAIGGGRGHTPGLWEKRCWSGCRARRLCNAFYDNHRAVPARSGPPQVIMSRTRFSTPPQRRGPATSERWMAITPPASAR